MVAIYRFQHNGHRLIEQSFVTILKTEQWEKWLLVVIGAQFGTVDQRIHSYLLYHCDVRVSLSAVSLVGMPKHVKFMPLADESIVLSKIT